MSISMMSVGLMIAAPICCVLFQLWFEGKALRIWDWGDLPRDDDSEENDSYAMALAEPGCCSCGCTLKGLGEAVLTTFFLLFINVRGIGGEMLWCMVRSLYGIYLQFFANRPERPTDQLTLLLSIVVFMALANLGWLAIITFGYADFGVKRISCFGFFVGLFGLAAFDHMANG